LYTACALPQAEIVKRDEAAAAAAAAAAEAAVDAEDAEDAEDASAEVAVDADGDAAEVPPATEAPDVATTGVRPLR